MTDTSERERVARVMEAVDRAAVSFNRAPYSEDIIAGMRALDDVRTHLAALRPPTEASEHCPTCGARVRVHTSDEGTSCYEPDEDDGITIVEPVFNMKIPVSDVRETSEGGMTITTLHCPCGVVHILKAVGGAP